MVLTDPNLQDHPMIAVNAAFEALTGYPAAETVGRNCRFLQGAETDAATPSRIGRCIAERRGCIEWIVNYRADGTKFWNLLFISPVFDRDGTLLHFFGNQRDITEGPPSDLPDYTLGKADMPRDREMAFPRPPARRVRRHPHPALGRPRARAPPHSTALSKPPAASTTSRHGYGRRRGRCRGEAALGERLVQAVQGDLHGECCK